MFKIGDIVKFKDEYYQDIIEPYMIISGYDIWSGSYRIKGLITNRQKLIQYSAIELDKTYYRKLKINKICSNLEIK